MGIAPSCRRGVDVGVCVGAGDAHYVKGERGRSKPRVQIVQQMIIAPVMPQLQGAVSVSAVLEHVPGPPADDGQHNVGPPNEVDADVNDDDEEADRVIDYGSFQWGRTVEHAETDDNNGQLRNEQSNSIQDS
jgi:hypothetical protein